MDQSPAAAPAVARSPYTWQEGRVDQQLTHLEIYYVLDLQHEGPSFLIAAIAPPKNHVFVVELLSENLPVEMECGSIIDGLKREINFYLIEISEPDPWKYARYHCTTASNFHSHFQWAVSDR